MTEDMMSLRTFVEKTPDADLLREMIGFAGERGHQPSATPLPGTRSPPYEVLRWYRCAYS